MYSISVFQSSLASARSFVWDVGERKENCEAKCKFRAAARWVVMCGLQDAEI